MSEYLLFLVVILIALSERCVIGEYKVGSSSSTKTKRQLYREQLLPQRGGKIPDGAFQVDRLAANRLSKEGISVPDGILLEQRHHESHFNEYRHDLDVERSIIRLKQTPDGRYTPSEGRYPSFENEIESTYIIRSPAFDNYNFVLPAFRPNFVGSPSLQFPSKQPYNKIFREKKVGLVHQYRPFANHHHHQQSAVPPQGFNNDQHQPPQPQQPDWNNLNTIFPELYYQSVGYENSRNKGYIPNFPSLTEIPITSFVCDRSGRMYPDAEAKCQAFHLCHYDGRKETFLCPPGTRFEPRTSECNPWHKTQCIGLQ